MTILKDGATVAETERGEGGLSYLKTSGEKALFTRNSNQPQSVRTWRNRLAHLGEDNLRKLANLMSTGIHLKDDTSLGVCESCIAGKRPKSIQGPHDKSI